MTKLANSIKKTKLTQIGHVTHTTVLTNKINSVDQCLCKLQHFIDKKLLDNKLKIPRLRMLDCLPRAHINLCLRAMG